MTATMSQAELEIRMADHLVVDETVAMPALAEGKLVCALRLDHLGSPVWGLVESIEPITRRGQSAAEAFTVTFAGDGYVRVFCKGGTFWVEVTA